MNVKATAVVVVAVLTVCAACAIIVLKDDGNGNGANGGTDFGLLQEDKLCPGVVAERHVQAFHETWDNRGVIVDAKDGEFLADFQLDTGEYKSWMTPDLFYGFGLLELEFFTFPDDTTITEEKHMGVKMNLYEFKGHLTGPAIDYDFTDGRLYEYGGYIWDGSGHFMDEDLGKVVDFSCGSNIYKDESMIDPNGQPDMSLLDEEKVCAGFNADTAWFKGDEDHFAEFAVEAIIDNIVYGRYVVDDAPYVGAPKFGEFLGFALMPSDGSEFKDATVTTEEYLDVEMTVYSFNKGQVTTKFFDEELESVKVYIYEGFIWRVSGTTADTGEKFYCTSALFMT